MNGSSLYAFIAALGLMTLMGYLLGSLLLSRRFSAWFIWALAPATGAALCSLIDFLFRRPMFTVEGFVFLVLLTAWLWRRGWHVPDARALFSWRAPVLAVLLAGALGWAFGEMASRVGRVPHGGWDGWAIWNSHARYIYRDGRQWQQHIEHTFHADYPLLVPLMSVRLWRFAGEEVTVMGGVFGLLFALSGIAVLTTALIEGRRESMGLVLGLVLLSTPRYLMRSIFQEADVPLSVFILCALALLFLHFEHAPNSWGVLALSGFMAGSAGWTKNEGVLFIVVLCGVLMTPVFWRPAVTLRRLAAFGAGLLLPLAVIIFFKTTIAPQNDLMWNRHPEEVVEKLSDPSRYVTIFQYLRRDFRDFGGWAIHPMIPLVAFLLFWGVSRKTLRHAGWLSVALSVALMLAGYYMVYVLTPLDLKDHLDGSLQRLLLHLWPSLLLLIGLATTSRTPGESLDPSAGGRM